MVALLRALGRVLSESLNATTKKLYIISSVGMVTLIEVLALVVVPPLSVASLPDSA